MVQVQSWQIPIVGSRCYASQIIKYRSIAQSKLIDSTCVYNNCIILKFNSG